MPLLEVKNVKKIYTTRFGGNRVQALADVNFSVDEGEYVAIMGESGSGKTTLLNILAALDKPTGGQVLLEGRDTVHIPNGQMAAFRRDNLGFVFQAYNLLPGLTATENVAMPLLFRGVPPIRTSPRVGFSMPASWLSKVLLPEPEVPKMQQISPRMICKSICLRATTVSSPRGYSLRRPFTSMMGRARRESSFMLCASFRIGVYQPILQFAFAFS